MGDKKVNDVTSIQVTQRTQKRSTNDSTLLWCQNVSHIGKSYSTGWKYKRYYRKKRLKNLKTKNIGIMDNSVDKVPLRRLGFALIAIYGYKSKKINNILCIKNLRKGKSD